MEFDIQQLINEFNQEFPPEQPAESSDANVSGADDAENPVDAENASVDDTQPQQEQSADDAEAGAGENVQPEDLESDTESYEPSHENPLDDLSQQLKQRQSPETNRAFAEMRRKLREAEKAQKFLEKIAQDSGVTLDQLMEIYEQRRIEQEAQKTGVPVDVYRRLQALEEENRQIKKQSQLDRFFSQVDTVKQKYGLDNEAIDRTFQYIGSKGLFDPDTKVPIIDFEDAYFLANRDDLIKKKAEEARQQMLAEKKRRQQQAAIPHGGNAPSAAAQSVEWTDEEVEKQLAKLGLLDRIKR